MRVLQAAEGAIIGGSASARLDAYLAELYAGRRAGGAELGEQLALLHAQLLYERWRREAHAERNRRLLGRCRQARALELQNQVRLCFLYRNYFLNSDSVHLCQVIFRGFPRIFNLFTKKPI